MALLDNIPIDVFDLIIEKVSQWEPTQHSDKVYIARDAARCATVGHPMFRKIADVLWDKVSPGCVQRAEQDFINATHAIDRGDPPSMPTDVTPTSSLATLAAKCKELRCRRCTGTKAQLWQSIEETVRKSREAHATLVADDATRLARAPHRRASCPLSASDREMIMCFYNVRICASRAKQMYNVKDRDLDNLGCRLVANPYYRNAHPMRMYLVREVIALKQHGVEKVVSTRRSHLTETLEYRGLGKYIELPVCQKYIHNGNGTVCNIVRVLGEMDFLLQHTNYFSLKQKDFQEPIDVKQNAQYNAFFEWVKSFPCEEDALLSPIIPSRFAIKLANKIQNNIFEGEVSNAIDDAIKVVVPIKWMKDLLQDHSPRSLSEVVHPEIIRQNTILHAAKKMPSILEMVHALKNKLDLVAKFPEHVKLIKQWPYQKLLWTDDADIVSACTSPPIKHIGNRMWQCPLCSKHSSCRHGIVHHARVIHSVHLIF